MIAKRRVLKKCEYGVQYIYPSGPEVGPCDEPATVKWSWGKGVLFVCDEHDEVVGDSEEERKG